MSSKGIERIIRAAARAIDGISTTKWALIVASLAIVAVIISLRLLLQITP